MRTGRDIPPGTGGGSLWKNAARFDGGRTWEVGSHPMLHLSLRRERMWPRLGREPSFDVTFWHFASDAS